MTEESEYSLTEFCTHLQLDSAYVTELVTLGILNPTERSRYWYFSVTEVRRCESAERLRRDLGLDLPGIALALDLVDRNRLLQARVDYLEQLISRLYD